MQRGTQVIVGVLLFMPLLLLLPTVAVFYACAVLQHAAAVGSRVMLHAASELIRVNSLAGLLLWLARPGMYPGNGPVL